MTHNLPTVIQQYKQDPESVYHTWFIKNEDRLKAFRSIRRGVMDVIQDIKAILKTDALSRRATHPT